MSGEYAIANPTWHKEDSPWKVEQIFRVFDFQPQNRPMKICDIGCGVGGVLATLDDLLQTRSIHVDMTGYDISTVAIEHARINCRERQNIIFECCDVLSMDRLECDLCLLIDVLEHLEDPRGFLVELCERGIRDFVVHLPLENTWIGTLRGKTNPRRSPVGHLHFYNTYSALSLLREASLKVNRWVYTPEFNLDVRLHRTFLSVLAYLPRKALFNVWPKLVAHSVGGVSLMSWCSLI